MNAALDEAGHTEIVLRLPLLHRDCHFCAEIGLGSSLIFITSSMHKKNAESILEREIADKTYNLIISNLLNIINNFKFHQ